MMQSKPRSLLCTALVAAGMAMSAGVAFANNNMSTNSADDQASTTNQPSTATGTTIVTQPSGAVILRDPSGSSVVTTTPGTTYSVTPRAGYMASSGYAAALRTRDAQMAACGQRPSSLKEMCVLQAQSEFDHAVTAMREPSTRTAAVQQIESDYSNALKACSQLISSEKDTCNARAQADRSRAMGDLAAASSDRRLSDANMRAYQSAVTQCSALPSSERDMCIANAGLAPTLPSQG